MNISFAFDNSGIGVSAYFSRENTDEIFIPLLERLRDISRQNGKRALAFLSAPPGAGKSTLAAYLKRLSGTTDGLLPVCALGMDGFHRRQSYLLSHTVTRGGAEVPMVSVKGAPETFDLDALVSSVARVSSGENFGWPAYDRLLHDPIPDALFVSGDIVLIEGNYLLLKDEGWNKLIKYADYTVKIVADAALLRRRLIARHMASGKSAAEAERFVDQSDLVNARLCLKRSAEANLNLCLNPDNTFGKI